MTPDVLKNLKPILSKEALDTPETAATIKKIRLELKISQKALAIEMGISQPYLADLEMAHRHWNMKWFELAKAALEKLEREIK